jgi:hypothetical protein
MESKNDKEISEILIGSWTREKYAPGEQGIIFDHYLSDGTKISNVTIIDTNGVKEISAITKWVVENNILFEEIISIDKKFSKKFNVKSGKKIRSYIVNCEENEVTFRLLGQKKFLEETLYKLGPAS